MRRFVPEQGRSHTSHNPLWRFLEHAPRQLVASALLHAAGDINVQTSRLAGQVAFRGDLLIASACGTTGVSAGFRAPLSRCYLSA